MLKTTNRVPVRTVVVVLPIDVPIVEVHVSGVSIIVRRRRPIVPVVSTIVHFEIRVIAVTSERIKVMAEFVVYYP